MYIFWTSDEIIFFVFISFYDLPFPITCYLEIINAHSQIFPRNHQEVTASFSIFICRCLHVYQLPRFCTVVYIWWIEEDETRDTFLLTTLGFLFFLFCATFYCFLSLFFCHHSSNKMLLFTHFFVAFHASKFIDIDIRQTSRFVSNAPAAIDSTVFFLLFIAFVIF